METLETKPSFRPCTNTTVAFALLLVGTAVFISSNTLATVGVPLVSPFTVELSFSRNESGSPLDTKIQPAKKIYFDDIYAVNISEGPVEEWFCKRSRVKTRFKSTYLNVGELLSSNDGSKYLMYSPSGGFNNQRSEIEYSLLIGHDLNRIPIIPKIAKHTTWWTKYAALNHSSLTAADYIFDLSHLTHFFPEVLITNQTVTELHHSLINASHASDSHQLLKVAQTAKRVDWAGTVEIRDHLGVFEDKVLFLRGRNMYHPWHTDEVRAQVSSKLRFNTCFRILATEVIKSLGPKFKAVHLRMGDYYKYGKSTKASVLIGRMQENGFNPLDKIYIATEMGFRRNRVFDDIRKVFPNLVFSYDFNFVYKSLKLQFGKENAGDLLGIVEQLICSVAEGFVGTPYSNFSRYIELMRGSLSEIFPEIDFVRDQIINNN